MGNYPIYGTPTPNNPVTCKKKILAHTLFFKLDLLAPETPIHLMYGEIPNVGRNRILEA